MKTRTIEILHRIMTAQYPVKAERLAAEFNVSQRTIRQEVLEANIWLSSKKLPEIRTIRNKGFSLKLENDKQVRLETEIKERLTAGLTRINDIKSTKKGFRSWLSESFFCAFSFRNSDNMLDI